MVMTQREKISMEALFRRVIPPHKRLGSQFVFRQASAANWSYLYPCFADQAYYKGKLLLICHHSTHSDCLGHVHPYMTMLRKDMTCSGMLQAFSPAFS